MNSGTIELHGNGLKSEEQSAGQSLEVAAKRLRAQGRSETTRTTLNAGKMHPRPGSYFDRSQGF